jgi:hypothetical protein
VAVEVVRHPAAVLHLAQHVADRRPRHSLDPIEKGSQPYQRCRINEKSQEIKNIQIYNKPSIGYKPYDSLSRTELKLEYRNFSSQSKLGFEIVTGTKPIASK